MKKQYIVNISAPTDELCDTLHEAVNSNGGKALRDHFFIESVIKQECFMQWMKDKYDFYDNHSKKYSINEIGEFVDEYFKAHEAK